MTTHHNVNGIYCKRDRYGIKNEVTLGCNIFKIDRMTGKQKRLGTYFDVDNVHIYPTKTNLMNARMTLNESNIDFGEGVQCSAYPTDRNTVIYCLNEDVMKK